MRAVVGSCRRRSITPRSGDPKGRKVSKGANPERRMTSGDLNDRPAPKSPGLLWGRSPYAESPGNNADALNAEVPAAGTGGVSGGSPADNQQQVNAKPVSPITNGLDPIARNIINESCGDGGVVKSAQDPGASPQ